MRKVLSFLLISAALTAGLVAWAATGGALTGGNPPRARSSTPELEYLKVVNQTAPPKDPQVLFLLMGAYANSGQPADGAAFLSARLDEFRPRLTPAEQSLYLSAIGVLRAQNAASVSLLHRIGYVNDTIAILDQAKKLSGGQVFVVNWISGVVRAQFPGLFHQKQTAFDDLTWCVANIAKAPNAGWLREVDFRLGKLALTDGDQTKAQKYLRLSGYQSFDNPVALNTPFSEQTLSGHTFSPRSIREVVPGRVYTLSGFEFTEYYFVVSDDHPAIDRNRCGHPRGLG